MTSTESASFTASTRPVAHPAERPLRVVLRLNAASSAVCGAIMAAAPGTVDDVLDTGRPGWVRIVGAALLPFAAFVAWLSTASMNQLRLHTPGIIVGDAGWVSGSIATIALGWYSGGGVALVAAMAVVVDIWAFLQWRAWRKLPATR